MAVSKNIAFLFGAGISEPAKMDSTDELTKKVLSGNIVNNISRFIEVDDPSHFSWNTQNEYVNRIRKLFELIRDYLGSHYSFRSRELNYEDYFNIVDSLHEDENMNFENPAVTFFSEYLLKEHLYLFDPIDVQHSRIRLIDLCSKAKDYIKDIVAFNLSKEPDTLNHLNFLNDVYNEKPNDNHFIFTLNHDTIIEQFLEANNVKYSDGFRKKDDNVKFWNKNNFNEKISLLKLHGSVNWHYDSSEDWYDDNVCIYTTYVRGADRPLLQIGSSNKIIKYNRGISFQLQCLFAKFLENIEVLIISGYSFGDSGVNNRIIDWFYSSRENKFIVIHRDPDSLKSKARPAIEMKWDGWKKSNSLINIHKYIEDVTWADIKNLL